MKIGILGNMNNMYFSLARYLADEGYDCDLLVFDSEPEHFHPGADTFEAIPLNLTVKHLSWGDAAHFLIKQRQAATDLQPYSFLIGNGTAPAFVHAAGRVLDLFIPYGEDLYQFPFVRLVHPLRQLPYLILAWHQMRGIRQASHLLFDKTSAGFDRIFQRIKYKGTRIVSPPPLLYSKEYETALSQRQTDNPYFAALQKLRSGNELLVLQHARQLWKPFRDRWSMKGNHHLIEGFAKFLTVNPSYSAKLLLFEYGVDVQRTKKLIDSLGIGEHVVWFPKTVRKNLMTFIQMSNVVVGELENPWNTYCVMMETLVMNKPLIHNRDDAYLTDAYPELYPMFQAASAKDVYEAFQSILTNKENALEIGRQGRRWFDKYCVQEPVRLISRLITEKQKRLHAQKSS